MIIPLLEEARLAEQIANLVNSQNQLLAKVGTYKMRRKDSTYLVEMVNDKVIGCIGIVKHNANWDEICHVSVIAELRGKGLGTRLFKEATKYSKKKLFCTIRENNIASIKAALSAGFEIRGKRRSAGGYWLLLLTKENKKEEIWEWSEVDIF